MRFIVFLNIFFACGTASASELAESIIELTGAKARYEKLFLSQIFIDSEIPASPGSQFYFLIQDHNLKNAQLREQYISWEAVKPLLIEHYDSVYTQSELNTWSNFLNSDAGKSIVEKSDRVDAAFTESIQTMFETYAAETSKLSDELHKEMERIVTDMESRQ